MFGGQPHGREGHFRERVRKPKHWGKVQSVKENMLRIEKEEKGEVMSFSMLGFSSSAR